MSDKQQLNLKKVLSDKMEELADSLFETPEWERLGGYVGENTVALMTEAAFAVLKGVIDIQYYFSENDMLK